MVCGSCHATHPVALTGLQFARSPDHFGGLEVYSRQLVWRIGRILADRVVDPEGFAQREFLSEFSHRVEEQDKLAVRVRAACSFRGPFSFVALVNQELFNATQSAVRGVC
jgi:hypothetical protein